VRPWEPEKVVGVVGNGRDASWGGSGEWGRRLMDGVGWK
jgi:hypothetical protein